jgi:hypothetical protein
MNSFRMLASPRVWGPILLGIVGGVSGATSERILGGLSDAGVPVPPVAGTVIFDPSKARSPKPMSPAGQGRFQGLRSRQR